MITEILTTALLACSLNSTNFRNEPRRAPLPNYGTYSITLDSEEPTGNTYLRLVTPTIGEQEMRFTGFDTNFSINNIYAEGVFSLHFGQGSNFYVDASLRLKCNDTTLEVDRLGEAYAQMQEDKSYNMGTGWEINEFNGEYWPEISLYVEWTGGSHVVTTATFNLPMMYAVNYETFGTTENNGRSWVKQQQEFSKTFNAIYTDNTEPKFYAFWIDRYMLARQIRLDGDIINQNYVTAMDRIDPSFGKQVSIHFTPSADVDLKVSAVPYDPTWSLTNDYNRGYNAGYEDGLEEGQTPVSWIKTTFDGIANFFNIQVFPFVTLGFLCFAPLIVVAIVAILRIIKHD